MKLGILTAAALLIIPGFAAPALAQRVCIVDNNNNVICGRPASERDLQRYNNNSQSDSQRDDIYKDINDIYQDLLGRSVTRNEFLRWSRSVDRGQPIKNVRQELAQTPEVQARINQIYREVLGRDVDATGLRDWTKNLMNGADLGDVRRGVQNSEEARRRNGR
jgi:hypothetical protein